MAKYVLLEFDSDEEADNFVAILDPNQATNGESKLRVAAIFKKPTQFCQCPKPGEKSVRGAKWGWWLHKECGKPKKGNIQSPKNLLEPEKVTPARRHLFLSIAEPRASSNE